MIRNKWLVPGLVFVVVLVGALWFGLTYQPEPEEDEIGDVESAEELGTRSVTLYFARPDADGFVSEQRSVASGIHREEEIEAVLAELLVGPRSDRAVSAFPRGTQLRRAFLDDRERILYLDFNGAIVSELNPGSASELALLGSLLRTVAIDFPEVESVQILVDGLEVETLGGHIDLTRPLRTGDWL